jgi:hypothetical protein
MRRQDLQDSASVADEVAFDPRGYNYPACVNPLEISYYSNKNPASSPRSCVPQENGAQNEKHCVQPQLSNHYEYVDVQEMTNAGAD